MRNLRASLIEVLHAEYVSFATAKGLRRRVVLGRHVLRNASISTVTLLGLNVGSLIGGAVITETVFAIPGVGRLMVDSIFSRDYAVVQGLTLVLCVLVSLVFLAVDACRRCSTRGDRRDRGGCTRRCSSRPNSSPRAKRDSQRAGIWPDCRRRHSARVAGLRCGAGTHRALSA